MEKDKEAKKDMGKKNKKTRCNRGEKRENQVERVKMRESERKNGKKRTGKKKRQKEGGEKGKYERGNEI